MSQKNILALATLALLAGGFLIFTASRSQHIFSLESISTRSQTAAVSGTGSGLVTHYTFDALNATDAAGSNTGTLVGNPTLISGKVGSGALTFNGLSSVQIADNSTIEGFGDFTLSAWFKLSGYGDPYITLLSKGMNGEAYKLSLYAPNQSATAMCWLNGGVPDSSFVPGGVQLNEWYHLVCTRTGSTLKTYWNGAEKTSSTYSNTVAPNNKDLIIGNTEVGLYPLNGSIDDVRIYNKGLTSADISELYALGSGSGGGGGGSVPPPVIPPAGDSTAPTVSIASPSNGSTQSGTITISANASDNVGVAGVTFKVDGSTVGSEDTSSPYSVSLNTSSITNGSHSLTATARDTSGNTANSSAVTITRIWAG